MNVTKSNFEVTVLSEDVPFTRLAVYNKSTGTVHAAHRLAVVASALLPHLTYHRVTTKCGLVYYFRINDNGHRLPEARHNKHIVLSLKQPSCLNCRHSRK